MPPGRETRIPPGGRGHCPQEGGTPCPHLDAMKRMTAEKDQWFLMPCAGKCCINCGYLEVCDFSCDHAEPEKARHKEDRRKIAVRRKQEQAQHDAPLLEINKTLWSRIAQARQAAGRSVEEIISATGRSYRPGLDDEFEKLENGRKQLTAHSETPFGFMISPGNVRTLIKTGDLLGVSIDYLLGRTDIPEMAGPGKESE